VFGPGDLHTIAAVDGLFGIVGPLTWQPLISLAGD
jgi:hypothetical protein